MKPSDKLKLILGQYLKADGGKQVIEKYCKEYDNYKNYNDRYKLKVLLTEALDMVK